MEAFSFRHAGLADLGLLLDLREEVLRAANGLPASADLGPIREHSCAYYQDALPSGEHLAILAFAGDAFAACGAVSFYRVLPTVHNPSGRKAYIMNLYTREAFRRRGLARAILTRLIEEARKAGAGQILLETTSMGRPLYESEGFVSMPDEMELVSPRHP
ncbi:MAG: GNAT family N-acetyltransferase [Christensenellaceae bacterium]|jgi:GNAT superfamily N-acetyltransferase|nr:GNAT family N-acetyltransferase [Christensenellaceae bacterium]